MVHCSAASPSQTHSSALAPATAALLALNRQGTWVLCWISLGYTAPVGGGGGGAGAAGSGQLWWALPSQAEIWSWVPLLVLPPGSSRHRFAAWFTRMFPGPWVQTWVPEPPQVPRTAAVPGAVPPLAVSRHRPLI